MRFLACALVVILAPTTLAQSAAYVSPSATGGSLGDPADPFPTPQAALTAGADELRIEAGAYGGGAVVDRSVVLRSWNGAAGAAEALDMDAEVTVGGDLNVASGSWLTLPGSALTLALAGNAEVAGVLDIKDNRLAIVGGTTRRATSRNRAFRVVESGFFQSSAGAELLIQDVPDLTASFATSGTRSFFGIPRLTVRGSSGTVRVEATPRPELDAVTTPGFTMIDDDGDASNGPTISIGESVDSFDAQEGFRMEGGRFEMNGTATGDVRQLVRSFAGFEVTGGEFLAAGGGVFVQGNATLGDGGAPEATLDLGTGGQFTALGSFSAATDARYLQRDGTAYVGGDYTFEGLGDDVSGITGTTQLNGGSAQSIRLADRPGLSMEKLVVDTRVVKITVLGVRQVSLGGGIERARDGDVSELRVEGTRFEPNISAVNAAPIGEGSVLGGSAQAHIGTTLARAIQFGTSGGATAADGYVFPVGTTEPRGGDRDVDFFRPLILQLDDDLPNVAAARVDYLGLAERPPLDTTPVLDGGLELGVLSDAFWKIFLASGDPSPGPLNIRLGYELTDAFRDAGGRRAVDLDDVRIVQWDCDGTNPRLAGTFEGDAPATAMRVAKIDGLANTSHHGVEIGDCAILGLAAPSSGSTSISDDGPQLVDLDPPRPNPAAGATQLRFRLPAPVDVRLAVFDAMGREVAVLVESSLPAGEHDVMWDGQDRDGQPVASGVYHARLTAGATQRSVRIVRVR